MRLLEFKFDTSTGDDAIDALVLQKVLRHSPQGFMLFSADGVPILSDPQLLQTPPAQVGPDHIFYRSRKIDDPRNLSLAHRRV